MRPLDKRNIMLKFKSFNWLTIITWSRWPFVMVDMNYNSGLQFANLIYKSKLLCIVEQWACYSISSIPVNINKRYPRDISILDQFQYTVSTRMHFRLMNSKQSWIINYEPYNMILSDECKNDSFMRLICFCRVGSASSSFSSMSFPGYNPFYNFMPSLWFIRIHIAHIIWAFGRKKRRISRHMDRN